jgi:class 3 adenylate cyclase
MDETRRLSVIMFTDMVGYSKKMQEDENKALKQLNEHNGILQHNIDDFQGKTIKTIGDAFMAEFDSVHNAIHSAVMIQRELDHRNSNAEKDDQINVRIGIHAGDIVFRDNDVFGDGVNIASRLESVAGKDQIFVSSNIYSMAFGKVEYPFKDIGPKNLKNIAQPVYVYQVLWDPALAISMDSDLAGRIQLLTTAIAILAVIGYFLLF